MPDIKSFFPEPDIILSLEPEELAGYLLEYLNLLSAVEQKSLNRKNFGLRVREIYSQEEIPRVFMEAWMWLERENLLVPRPGDSEDWQFITRRGKKLRNQEGLKAFQKANLLPIGILHPIIAQKVWSAFIRGEYDTAVFQAFKEIEVAVRTKGNFQPEDLGTKLMSKAFNSESGPLTDKSLPEAERVAMMNLYVGAIGYAKNPSSHRHLITDPIEAAELIIFASHLMKNIDR